MEPIQVFYLPRQEEVVDMSDYPQVPLPMGKDSVSDLAFIDMYFLHVTFDNLELREGDITGPAQRSYKFPHICSPF